jgi:hypothetical protein
MNLYGFPTVVPEMRSVPVPLMIWLPECVISTFCKVNVLPALMVIPDVLVRISGREVLLDILSNGQA